MPFRRLAVAVALVMGAIAAAAPRLPAHDWWLEPSRATARAGEPIVIGEPLDVVMWVGTAFRGDRVARDPKRLERFVALDAQGELEVAGEPGAEPAGHFITRAAGTTILVYRSHPANLYLRAPEFEKYVTDEGLERIVALRAERGQSAKMGLERYSRCAKALVQVEGAAPRGDREVGLPLELVALDDPGALAGGGALAVRLSFGGKPLEEALVMALERGHPEEVLKERSDADGRVRFVLPRSGFWLLKAVHMIDAPKETRLDWESFWASLTFELPPAPARSSAQSSARTSG